MSGWQSSSHNKLGTTTITGGKKAVESLKPLEEDKTYINVAYILLRFPCMTETFIAEEIQKIQGFGVKIYLYSLLSPRKEMIHPISLQLLSQAHYIPGIYAPSLWLAQIYFLVKKPDEYYKLFWKAIKHTGSGFVFSMKCLVIFLKSVWLAKELQKTAVQLVHVHFAWLPGLAGMVVSQLLDLPYTITTHAYDIYSENNNLFELTTGSADCIVTISEKNKRTILETWDTLDTEKIEVIHCGVDLEYFQSKKDKTPNEILQITSVGSLIEKKGHEYLVRACHELKLLGIQFQCVIVGEGELEGSLKDLIRELELSEEVSLAGPHTPDWVRKRLSQSDLFVLACVVSSDGDRDGIPVAIMEAMALEVPVVSTKVSGISELVLHEITGLLVPERDVRELAAAMVRLLREPALCQQLIHQARFRVTNDFDSRKNASRLARLFNHVDAVNSPRQGR